MRIIEPEVILETDIDAESVMKKIEKTGRVCYKSEGKIVDGSAEKFIKGILKRGHESVIEHESVTFRIICDRGVTHEIVRHRIASYSQESTRYCNYSKDGFGNEITVIRPCFWTENDPQYAIWKEGCLACEESYFKLLKMGASPQQARDVLPNSLKTEIVVTMNLREWRHFLRMRASEGAHPQMRQIAIMIYNIFMEKLSVFFGDIVV